MKLATKRLVLRQMTPDDLMSIQHYSSKESVTRFMLWGPNTLEDTQKFLDSVIVSNNSVPRYDYDFLVTLKDGTVIGACGLYFNNALTIPSVGYVFDDAYWNKGYATEATRALLLYAFNTLKVSLVSVTCDDENIGSSKVIEKCGFHLVEKRHKEFKKIGKRLERYYELSLLEYKLLNHKTLI